MVSGSGDLKGKIYRRAVREGMGEVSLDGTMLAVLMEIDGKTCVADIAGRLGIEIGATEQALVRMLEIRLVEPVEPELPRLDSEFISYLREQLSLAVGPIAVFLMEDACTSLGYKMPGLPNHLAAELVELLSREIRREEKRIGFKQKLLGKIKAKGY